MCFQEWAPQQVRPVNHVRQEHILALMEPACVKCAFVVLLLSPDQQAASFANPGHLLQRTDQKAALTVAQAIMPAIWAQPFALPAP